MAATRVPAPGGPFLKWAGGKARVVPFLDAVFPASFGEYHEPFMGAGAVFFHLAFGDRANKAHLSDLNDDLVQTFLAVRDDTAAVIRELVKLRAAHSEEAYYEARTRFNRRRLSRVRSAAHLIYLNKTGYNGLYRVNSKGEFNVPFGRYKNPRVFDAANLEQASASLRRATIEARGFATVIDRARAGDLVYFDPPYDPLSHTAAFTSYASAGFGVVEQEQLAEVFRVLDEMGVYVVLSNHDTPLVRKLYGEYRRSKVLIRRSINSNAKRRSDQVSEVIVRGHSVP